MGDGKRLIFPLPWPAGSLRCARRDARDKLMRVAPSLKIPPGHVLELEFVLIPPGRRRPSADYLDAWLEAVRTGFCDCLHCTTERLDFSHRFAKVPTPGGECLVKLRVVAAMSP